MSAKRLLDPRVDPATRDGFRERAFRVIFLHDTAAGRGFDIALIVLILMSVVVTILDSVAVLHARYADLFYLIEWAFTALFTLEYLARLAVVRRPWRYARSFYGIVDLLSVLPTYLSLVFPGAQFLLVIRVLRVLRIFRVLQLVRFVDEANTLVDALHRSRRKILVFVATVLSLVTVFGALMYLIEGPGNGFTSIPRSMYWAIVTMATVGFGDITPKTVLGQIVTSGIIMIGYGIIAVPTGIYAAELSQSLRAERDKRTCERCGLTGHELDARFCRRCGELVDGQLDQLTPHG
jgi:voltage-gated potassium channel